MMEAVIIAVITVTGSVLTSIISLIIEKKIRKKKEKQAKHQTLLDLNNHQVFRVIDNLIQNEIQSGNFSNNDIMKQFLSKRLQLTKNNINELIQHDIGALTLDRCKRLINDFMHGLNGFNDVDIISNYGALIKPKILEKFNQINNHTTIIMLNYINEIEVNNNYELFDHFFNLYLSFLKSLLTHVCFNMDFIMADSEDDARNNDTHQYNVTHNVNNTHYSVNDARNNDTHNTDDNNDGRDDVIYNKQSSNSSKKTQQMNKQQLHKYTTTNTEMIKNQLQTTMQNIEKNSKLNEYIAKITTEKKYINPNKFLFYFGIDAQIIYCTKYCNKLLNYPIERLIGSSVFSLVQFSFIDKFEQYLEAYNETKQTNNKHKRSPSASIKLKILDQQEKEHLVIICKCSDDDDTDSTDMYLCFGLS